MNDQTKTEQPNEAHISPSELNDGLCAADDHDWEYHQDTFGDPGVINGTGTERWLQCSICGETKPATFADMPGEDYYW